MSRKSLCDACVHAHILRDDNPKWCELGTVEYAPKRGPLSTTIVVEDVDVDVDGDGEGGGS